MGSFGIIAGAIALLIIVGLGAIEIQFRRRPGNKLVLEDGNWNIDVYEPDHYRIVGEMEFVNQTQRLEIMLPEVTASATLLSKGDLSQVQHTVHVTPRHADAPARPDGYWFGYIVKVGKRTNIDVVLEIRGEGLSDVQSAWVRVDYLTYGPQGRIPKTRHVVVPLRFPSPEEPSQWRNGDRANIMPIKTHLLTHLDTPVEVVKRYVAPHAKPGDIVTIGETPIAIMQDRFLHPSTLKPGWVAKRICYYFLPTSSLATACGMQTLVNIAGPGRVVFAFVVGAIAKKFFKKPGVFYQLAGEQARLIDDVTGTLPPYDQFIVLGPERPQQVVNQIEAETGLAAAIVDVNDLRAVKVLAASPSIKPGLLDDALRSNPAGNADEQTPVVLIRPK